MNENRDRAAPSQGKTTIAPGVLLTIARLTALGVPGVVRIEVDDDSVAVDLYLVLANETNAREVSRNVQSEVARAVEDMVGMQAKRIDIHIEDIDFGEAAG